MKTVTSVMLLLGLSLVINSCKKDPVTEPAKDITGQWIWLSSWTIEPLDDSNPKNPQNTGIHETIRFYENKTWLKIQNNVHLDSGTYSVGHGSYLPYVGAYNYIYDSVVYFRNGKSEQWAHDYYKIYNDTLQFSNGFAGICGGVSKFYSKQQ